MKADASKYNYMEISSYTPQHRHRQLDTEEVVDISSIQVGIQQLKVIGADLAESMPYLGSIPAENVAESGLHDRIACHMDL